MKRLALAGALVCAASAAFAAESAPPGIAAQAQAMAYVSGFCAPIALNDADPAAFGQLLAAWKAKAASGDAAAQWAPQDTSIPGQEFLFEAKDAPHAFVERRRSDCSLVYESAAAPALLISELKSVELPVGEQNELRPWRRVIIRRAGKPPPTQYFLAVGAAGSFGLCATIFEDLRLRNNAPATMVKVATCRMSGDETFDNG